MSDRMPVVECDDPDGHRWQMLTRHPDPPHQRGVLPNAICVHCSEQAWFDLESASHE